MSAALSVFSAAGSADFETRFEKALSDPKETNGKLGTIWVGSGDQDTIVRYDRVKQWVDLLQKRGINAKLRTVEGGAHTWPVWRLCLAEFAPILFQKP